MAFDFVGEFARIETQYKMEGLRSIGFDFTLGGRRLDNFEIKFLEVADKISNARKLIEDADTKGTLSLWDQKIRLETLRELEQGIYEDFMEYEKINAIRMKAKAEDELKRQFDLDVDAIRKGIEQATLEKQGWLPKKN